MRDEEFKRRLGLKLKLNKLLKEEGYSTKPMLIPKKVNKSKKEPKPEPPKIVEEVPKKKKWALRKNKNGQINMNNQLKYYLDKLEQK